MSAIVQAIQLIQVTSDQIIKPAGMLTLPDQSNIASYTPVKSVYLWMSAIKLKNNMGIIYR